MKSRVISTFVGVVGLALCVMAQSAKADSFEVVVKYSGKLVKMPGGPPHDAFQGLVMPTGPVLTFLVPNIGPAAGKPPTYDPDPKVDGVIKPLQAGDLLDIVYDGKMGRQGIGITSVTVYKAQPGEDDPHAWIFDEQFPHKVRDQDIQVVSLLKYKQKYLFLVPTHRDGTDLVPDDVIMGITGKLHQGQLVYAQTVGSGDNATVKMLAPWANHVSGGKLVKLDTDKTVDPNGDTGPAVELTDSAGKAITALIPGTVLGKKWVPESTVMGQARRLKPDADVDFLTADSGDGRTWLVSISAAKPPEKSAASGNTSNAQ